MDLNHKNMQKIALLIVFTIMLLVGLQNIAYIYLALKGLFRLVLPFIIGGTIAFILNVPMKCIERNLFPNKYGKNKNPLYKFRRLLSLLLTLALLIAVLSILSLMIIPEMAQSVLTVGSRISVATGNLIEYLNTLAITNPELVHDLEDFARNLSSIDWQKIGETIYNFFSNGNILGNTFNFASSVISGFTNFIIGIVFAIYILLQKETLGGQFKRVIYSFFPEKHVDRFLEICQLTSNTFSSFISGQCLEACILGSLFFISMTLLKMPYALVISVLIAITALIPVFGAFIGCGVGIFLILIVSPIKALWFLVLFLVLQQLENNLIYPHVVGGSVGLPSIWVLMAVTLGASTMGVIGMIINIPLFSVIYTLLKQSVRRRLRNKNINQEKLK